MLPSCHARWRGRQQEQRFTPYSLLTIHFRLFTIDYSLFTTFQIKESFYIYTIPTKLFTMRRKRDFLLMALAETMTLSSIAQSDTTALINYQLKDNRVEFGSTLR